MKVFALIVLLLFLNNDHSFGQRKLNKKEILKYWNSPSHGRTKDSTVIVNSDSSLNVKLIKLVDSLQTNNIDSIIIISTAYPGYYSTSKCDTGIFPIISFVIWSKDGVTNIKKLKESCLSEIASCSSTYLFDFYDDNAQRLQSEYFMPVILDGKVNKDKTVSYSMSWIDHEPNYSFYYNIGQHHKSFHFCQSYLDNNESLFRNYNLSLSAYQWWTRVKNTVDKVD